MKQSNTASRSGEKKLIPFHENGNSTDPCEAKSEQFRQMFDSLPAAIYTTDAEGKLTYFNPAAVEFAGNVPELGTDKWNISWKLYRTDGTRLPHDLCPMAITLKEGRSVKGEIVISEQPNGKRTYFEAHPSLLYDDNGNITGGINMLVDITNRIESEERIRQNEKILSDFFENAAIGLHLVGPGGNIIRINKKELELLGYTAEELVGRHISEIHADKKVIEDIPRRLKAGEKLVDYEAPLRCKDGSIRHVLINSNVYKENGKFVHTRCFTSDITERKKTEQIIQNNKKRLASKVADMKRLHTLSIKLLSQENVESALKEVMNSSKELMNADKASVQIYEEKDHNLRLVDTIGFDVEFFNKFQIIDADGYTTCSAALKRKEPVLLEDCENTTDFADFRLICKSYGMNAVLSTPLISGDGELFGVFSMYWKNSHRPPESKLQLLDLYIQQATRQIERTRAEEQLQALNESLEERVKERTASLLSYQDQLRYLASQLSRAEEDERHRLAAELHDNLGQLLAVTKIELDLLQKKNIPEELTENIYLLTNFTEEAIRYTRELMSDLKPPPGLDKEELGNLLSWMAQKMKKHGLKVTIIDDEQSNSIDEEIRLTLLQAVRELLFNVVKHAKAKEAVISVSRKENTLVLVVEDKGVGFDSEKKNLSDVKEGGFGLFHIRERLNLLSGNLEINSRIGEGTQVTITVPLKPKKAEGIFDLFNFSGSKTSNNNNLSKKIVKVLLVDDHKMIRSGLKKMIELEEDMAVIAEASNGKEAVELAHGVKPDVILMDVDMPIMNGVEATRQIHSFLPNTRIIGLSLHESAEVERSMRNAGATVYLNKSDVYETLCATIRSEAKTGVK